MKSSRLIACTLLCVMVTGLALIAGCSFRTPATETPIPNNNGIEKSFFVDANGKPKTFLCGWAPETEMGAYAESMITHNIPLASHCNIQFEITEDRLVGKMIHPSHPNEPSRWETVITIPIRAHYYLEKSKDSYGREGNEIYENSGRSHWSARPYMKLDLTGISVQKWAYALMYSGRTGIVNSVEDVEWDKENNFLGFSIVTSDPELGSDMQARIRVNFLKFDHNPNFVKTPFNDMNYRYLNALHIAGEKAQGVYPILYAAHWDLNKSRKVYLNGFPEKYIELGKATVEAWNQALRETGAISASQKPFVADTTPRKHTFDLRYTSITWVEDAKISATSPLGVGNAHADVRNGEILWGGITIYGGMIESYIKSYMGSAANGSVPANNFANKVFDPSLLSKALSLPSGLKQFTKFSQESISPAALENLTQSMNGVINDSRREATAKELDLRGQSQEHKAAALNALEESLKQKQLPPEMVRQMVAQLGALAQTQNERADQFFAGQNFQSMLLKQIFPQMSKQDALVTSMTNESDVAKKADREAMSRLQNLQHGNLFDLDRRFVDVEGSWSRALAASRRDYKDVIDSVVKELLMHEYGHMLGLGHQFKEGLLPEEGSVPDRIYQDLKTKATPEAGFINFTSVMGYRHPETEIADHVENIKPGEQDKLVLTFLYRQKYATYRKGDDKFTFFDLPKDGIIPTQNQEKPEYKTAYFKQCNDLEASLALDPYCNRFDRGSNATEIVDNYINDFKSNLVQSLFAFTDARGGNAWVAEYYLWNRSLNTMGRLRLFYDYMRREYAKDIAKISSDETALYEFSTACTAESNVSINSPALQQVFTDKPELKELCAVNKRVVSEINELVSLNVSDYTKIDFSNAYVPGGMSAGDAGRDFSRFLGTWNELSGLPLKISALYALNSPIPWVNFGGYMTPVPTYDHRDLRFGYSALYPREHTQAISSALEHNLRFASLGQSETTTIGDVILALSYFNALSRSNNDANRFPSKYIETIRDQTKFNFNFVAILLEAKKKEDSASRYYAFDAKVYDMQTGKSKNATEAYILPGGKVIVRAENMFLLPVTDFQLIEDTSGYVFAYKLDYQPQYGDILAEDSVKSRLRELYDRVLRACVTGQLPMNEAGQQVATGSNLNGLSQFFNRSEPEFPGFYMPPDISKSSGQGNDEKLKLFYKSIDESFDAYYGSKKFMYRPRPETCRETIRGLQVIVSAAALLNGYWIPEAVDYIQK